MSNCNAQPTTVIVLPDPVLQGSHNVFSATSQAGPCTPRVVVDDDNCGTLEPQIQGVPTDPTLPPLEFEVVGTGGLDEAGYVFRPSGGAALFRGSDDGRRYSRSYAHFYDLSHPDIDAGTGAEYVPAYQRILTTAVDPVASEIRIAYRRVDDLYDSWTEYGIDPASLGAPALDPAQPAGTHRVDLVVLENGTVLLGYLYLKRAAPIRNYAVALLKSLDGGLTWEFLRDDVISAVAETGDMRLTASGSWVRVDSLQQGTLPRSIQSAASSDHGLSWSARTVSPLIEVFAEPGGVGDPLPFAVAGLGGGSFLLATVSSVAVDGWQLGSAQGASAWVPPPNPPNGFRLLPGTPRGMGATVSNGRVYVLISYDDGGGSSVDDQVALYYHPVAGALGEGPGAPTPLDPPADQWQLVEPTSGYLGDRFLPMRIRLMATGQYLFVYASAYDHVDDAERVFNPVVQIGGLSVQSYGNLQPGDQLTSSSSPNTEEPLFDVLWQNISSRPAGGAVGPGGATSPDTLWIEGTTGAPTVSYTPRRLSLITGVGDQVSYTATRPAFAVTGGSWVLRGSTWGAIMRCLSGSSQAATLHGARVRSLTTATDEVEFDVRIDTLGVTIYDVKAAAIATAVAKDMTDWAEVRVRFEEETGPTYTGTVVVMRMDDYFAIPVTSDFTLTSAAGVPEDRIRWGSVTTGTGESEWREVWISKDVTRDRGTFSNPGDMLGLPLADLVYLENGLFVSWGGASGQAGDSFATLACFLHGADKPVVDDTSLVGWRSGGLTPLGAQTLIYCAHPTDTEKRFVHDMVVFSGLEQPLMLIDYDNTVAFAAPSPTSTLDTTIYASLPVGTVSGDTITIGATVSIRRPIPGELAEQRLQFTSGALAGEVFCVLRHCDDCLTLSGDVSTAAPADTFTVFATAGWTLHGSRRVYRYMRLTLPLVTGSCTGDQRIGHILPGCRLDVPFPLEWAHEDDEQSAVEVFAGPFSDHAQRLGANRRRWTGRIVNDYEGWRESFRYLLRTLSQYETRVGAFIPDEGELRSLIRGRFTANPHENSFWWDQDDGDGPYRRPGGDRRIDVLEVP